MGSEIWTKNESLLKATIPTSAVEVRELLRSLGEPITLFGEEEFQRRERLRNLTRSKEIKQRLGYTDQNQCNKTIEQNIITRKNLNDIGCEGPLYLRNIRLWLAKYTITRSFKRLSKIKRSRGLFRPHSGILKFNTLVNDASEIGSNRPMTCCTFNHMGDQLVTGDFSGDLKIWSGQYFAKSVSIKARSERITGVATSPKTDLSYSNAPMFATCSADSTARLWTSKGLLVSTLYGHNGGLCRVVFHPSGRLLITASSDQTWRLWDLERSFYRNYGMHRKCVYEQDGHSQPVHSIAVHSDGSLISSGGLDSRGRVWDIRIGRCILTLDGHADVISAMDYSADGYHLVTGSFDNTCRVWDLRRATSECTVAAHCKPITSVKYEPESGVYFVTSSFDHQVRAWSAQDHRLLQMLTGHGDKVMGVDVHPNTDLVASVSFDRTLKLWRPRSLT